MVDVPEGRTGLVIAGPLPYEFFKNTGVGESDDQSHAGSYHMAMNACGIQQGNLLAYSSTLSPIAKEISVKEGYKRIELGSETKIIQAAAHIDLKDQSLEGKVKRASAGILFGWLRPKKGDKTTHEGGLVCEYNGHATQEEAHENLTRCIQRIYTTRSPISKKIYANDFDLDLQPMLFTSFEPKMQYGTALAVLCFVSYHIDVLAQNVFANKEEAERFAQAGLGAKGL